MAVINMETTLQLTVHSTDEDEVNQVVVRATQGYILISSERWTL